MCGILSNTPGSGKTTMLVDPEVVKTIGETTVTITGMNTIIGTIINQRKTDMEEMVEEAT